jgi:hypothetical protein
VVYNCAVSVGAIVVIHRFEHKEKAADDYRAEAVGQIQSVCTLDFEYIHGCVVGNHPIIVPGRELWLKAM